MTKILKMLSALSAIALLGVTLSAQTPAASRNNAAIESRVEHKLDGKKQFHNVKASVEDGIVSLTGTVDLYQQKLDAAKHVRKLAGVEGVRNLIAVEGKNVTDQQLAASLDRKLFYDRIGYDNEFNFVTASVQNGVATLNGETRTELDRDSALAIANTMPGVKDVVNNIKVSPVSTFDDTIRIQALRAIYRDPVLSGYGTDPALPIRIVVDNGHLTLYGVVNNAMQKNIAGIRANEVFGVFSVQNNLEVAKHS
ncbi:MAG: BON domain-containing protein [Acidobacteriales bacterium]|nr:BON domain-containing protein [Terriglobales bacterium]